MEHRKIQRKRSWRIPKVFRQCVYVPPIHASTSPNLPETADDIQLELRKQESLLSQIHSEMNAGFVTKKREEELWETQRIITQLKRKLRTFEKKDSMQKSMDTDAIEEAIDFTLRRPDDDDQLKSITTTTNEPIVAGSNNEEQKESDTTSSNESSNGDKIYIAENGMFMLPKDHPDYFALMRLQLENQELMKWKQQLQSRISSERSEYVRLKKLLENQVVCNDTHVGLTADDPEFDRLIEHYVKENSLLEQKRLLLAKEIVEENLSLIQLQVDLAMKQVVN